MKDLDVFAAMQPQPLAQHVVRQEYAAADGVTHLQVQQRVAHALAVDSAQQLRFLQLQVDGFVPGGHIASVAGLLGADAMIDCFVQPVEDTISGKIGGLPGIMDALAEAAETVRRGGAVGLDFSRLRPAGAKVRGTGVHASGPVSYMRVFDRACAALQSGGLRVRAQVGLLRVDHPDIEAFIDAKRTPDFKSLGLDAAENEQLMRLMRTKEAFGAAVREAFDTLGNFDISVGVTDAFMRAVMDDDVFRLVHAAEPGFEASTTVCDDGVTRYVYGAVSARALWERIMRNTHECGTPDLVYVDTVNRGNNLWYCEKIEATSPRAQDLPPYGCRCVGSHNLTRFVLEPFSSNARFDFAALARASAGAVELLDRVLDVAKWPLPQQAAEAAAKRRLGMGVFGLGDAMAMLGLRYGSPESATFAAEVCRTMRDAAYLASVGLAMKLGAFPLFDAQNYLTSGTFASTLPQDIQDQIRNHGIRNSHLISIAPTDTMALAFGDNPRSGIEPILRVTGQHHLAIAMAVAAYMDAPLHMSVSVARELPLPAGEDLYMEAWKQGM